MDTATDTLTLHTRILNTLLTLEGDTVYTGILDILRDVTGSAIAICAGLHEDGTVTPCALATGSGAHGQPETALLHWVQTCREDHVWTQAIRRKRSWIANTPVPLADGHDPVDNVLIVPLLYLNRAVGFFALANRQGGYGAQEQAQVELAGAHVAPLLHARLERRSRDAARDRSEQALRESEARWRAYLDASTDIAFLKDADFRYLATNQANERFIGRSAGEILGRTDFELLPEAEARNCRASDEQTLREGRVLLCLEQVGDRTFEARKFPVPLGATTGVGGIIRDITAQRNAEVALHESEARYRRLAESTEAVLWEYDMKADRWAYVAPQSAVVTGWPPEAWTDYTFWCDRLHPEDREPTLQICTRASARGEAHILEYRFRKPDGSYVWLHDSVTVEMQYGVPHQLRGFLINITQRRQAEEELFRSEAQLRSLVEILQYPAETIQDLLDHTLQQALVLTGSSAGFIFHYSEKNGMLTRNTWSNGVSPAFMIPGADGTCHIDETGLWGEPVRQRGPIIVNDYHAPHPLKKGLPQDHMPLHRFMSVPVFSGGEIVAVVGLSNKAAPYTEVDVLQLTLVMDTVWKVADRRRAEEALAHERRLLRTVIDNLPDTIYAKDRQARKTLANRADLRAIGAASETEVLGKTDADLFPVTVSAPLMADDLHVLKTGEPVRQREECVIDNHGVARWLLTSKFPIKDDAGEITGLVGTGRDITDRKRLLAQVEVQARQVEQIIETVPQGVLLLEVTPPLNGSVLGTILLANPVAREILALSRGSPDDRISYLGDRPLVELLTSPPEGLWHEVSAAGRIFEVIARPVATAHPPEPWVLVINDVTQQRLVRAQLQQQERLAALGQLAAGIAHDFNNIMAVIVLYAQMLSQNVLLNDPGPLGARAQKHLLVIRQQAQEAAQLIQQILDFSRSAMLDRKPLDLLPLIKEQVKLLARMLPETIRIAFVHSDERVPVHADPTRIRQMVMNLAINARDAMSEGGILEIELTRLVIAPGTPRPLQEMADGTWISLAVSDTGSGIAPEVLPHIYEPFFTTKAPGEGAGLGLAQVHGIVGQHGGHIAVQTQVGAGTRFTLYLPALVTDTPIETDTGTPDLPRGGGDVVLVVEDNLDLRRALCAMLEQWGYVVHESGNGIEALALLERVSGAVDVVLSDVVMPEMGGATLVRELRARGWVMPVILLSGHPRTHAPAELEGCGVHAWLPKPPALDQLAGALAGALNKGA